MGEENVAAASYLVPRDETNLAAAIVEVDHDGLVVVVVVVVVGDAKAGDGGGQLDDAFWGVVAAQVPAVSPEPGLEVDKGVADGSLVLGDDGAGRSASRTRFRRRL